MKKQISRISPHQSSKVIAVIYGVITLPIVLIGIAAYLFANPGKTITPFLFMIFAPVIYAIVGYLFFGLFCLVYNLAAGWVGGMEFETTDEPDA